MFKRILVVLGLSLFALHSQAATLIVDGGGQLTGATGVNVGGTLYDVNFVDGGCVDLFEGCDSASDFTFQSLNGALAASAALISEVFVDFPSANHDTLPSTTVGCTNSIHCQIWTPYNANANEVHIALASNGVIETDDFTDDTIYGSPGTSFVIFNATVYADWSLTPVPVPAASWLFISALLGFIGLQRKSRQG